jgi:predicted Zn-dependent protease
MYELLDYALSYAEQKGTNQAEAYFIESRSVSVVVERKEVTSVDSKSDAGMGVRVLLNKSGEFTLGSAYTTSSTMSGIETMVKEAISIAKAKPAQRDLTSFHDRKKVQSVENLFDGRIASVEPTGACRLAKDMIESASLGEQIGSISGDILFLFYRTGLNNSLGIEAGYSSTVLNASCYVTAKNSWRRLL